MLHAWSAESIHISASWVFLCNLLLWNLHVTLTLRLYNLEPQPQSLKQTNLIDSCFTQTGKESTKRILRNSPELKCSSSIKSWTALGFHLVLEMSLGTNAFSLYLVLPAGLVGLEQTSSNGISQRWALNPWVRFCSCSTGVLLPRICKGRL